MTQRAFRIRIPRQEGVRQADGREEIQIDGVFAFPETGSTEQEASNYKKYQIK
jgi:hypothetical protein